MAGTVLYIAPSLPLLTCTFIYREIFDLRDLGLEIETVSMNKPPIDKVSDEALSILENTIYLDEVSFFSKVLAFARSLFTHPRPTFRCISIFFSARPMRSLHDYLRLGYHLIDACYLSFIYQENKPAHIHSHFITGATSIGMFLSELISVPFSFTMHASALWIDPIALETKLSRCKFCVSISEYNKKYVLETYGEQWRSKFNIVHCGINLPIEPKQSHKPKSHQEHISVLAVGQLMKRKGYHILIEAAKITKEHNPHIRWTIVGDGSERPVLEKLIQEFDLHDTVFLDGAQPHEKIPDYLDAADIFTLPCVIGTDNTRDGIPVALMEAMAWQLPVVSTNIVGLPELISSGLDGILVAPDSPVELAEAVMLLADSPDLRDQIGAAAAAKVASEFNAKRSAIQLAELFGNP